MELSMLPTAATTLTTPTEIGRGTAGAGDVDGEEARTPALGRKRDELLTLAMPLPS
jgi:hypothetical protein